MNTIAGLCGYIVVILLAIYTLYCFTVFRRKDREKQNKIFAKQKMCMFLMHFICNVLLFVVDFDSRIIMLYGIELVFFLCIMKLYEIIYRGLSRLVLNNIVLLSMVGLIMLKRIKVEYAVRQLIFIVAGLAVCLLVPLIIKKFRYFGRFGWQYGFIGIIILGALLVVGVEKYGAKNWLSIGGILIQPLEFVKIIFVFAIAALLAGRPSFKKIVAITAMAAAHVLILVLEKDLGGALLYFLTYLVILVVSTGNVLYLVAGLFAGGTASVLAYRLFAHVRRRVLAWRDPWANVDDAGYQIAHSLFAIGTGGWFGMGLGRGIPKIIPVVESDYIFSAICEELGGIFGICLIMVYVSCFIMVSNISIKIDNLFYKFTALGLGIMFMFQVFLSIGGVTKLIPSTGVTLPLISYGGSSVISTILTFSIIQGMYVLYGSEVDKADEAKEKAHEGE